MSQESNDLASVSGWREAGRPRVLAVIVHYGAAGPTVEVARSVLPLVDELVVAVNDRSSRPSDLPSSVVWAQMPRNLGYGTAFDVAIQGRAADFYVLLNNDIEMPAESFRKCVELLECEDSVGVVGPVLRYQDGGLQSGAGRLTRISRAPRPHIDPDGRVVDCEWVTGAAMFLRATLVDAIGMDGSYFLGYEDTDFCVRAQRSGSRVVCHGGAPAVHHGSRVISGPRWRYHMQRNRVWFVRKCFGIRVAWIAWLIQVALLPRILLADIFKRRDLTSSRLALLAARHAWLRKPLATEGPRMDEPVPAAVMRW